MNTPLSRMGKNQDLFAFGVNYSRIDYEGSLDWFIQFTSLEHVWKYQPTYLITHFLYIFGGLATLAHAIIRGGRLPYLWVATVLHGFVIESLSYALPDVDNFWHSQTPVMFLGRRLPIHIIVLYPCFIYQSFVAVSKLKLPRWSEPFAVGLGSVLVDSIYDIVAVNFSHWKWHDTDPNIEDRFYWVPWNSFYFHATFAASFAFWFRFSRKLVCKKDDWEADTPSKEIICTLIAALLGTPGGILMFIPIYHPLHDILKLHSETTFCFLFTIFLLIIWLGDRTTQRSAKPSTTTDKVNIHWSTWILLGHLVAHYATFISFILFFKPENEIAIGLGEPIGPCDEYVPIQTAFGMILKKRKWLCATDYDEKYFDWSCLPGKKPPALGSIWYTSCAVRAPNMAELSGIAICFAVIAAVTFGTMHLNSFGDDVFHSNRVINRKAINLKKKKK